jgi:hypothetical protein
MAAEPVDFLVIRMEFVISKIISKNQHQNDTNGDT